MERLFPVYPPPFPFLVQTAVKFTAKPFTDKTMKYDKMFFFDPMNMKFPGGYRWVSFTDGSLRLGVFCVNVSYNGRSGSHLGARISSMICPCIMRKTLDLNVLMGILINYANSYRAGLPSLGNVRGIFPRFPHEVIYYFLY